LSNVTRLIRFSDDFPDAGALLAACAPRGLEGIVSKRRDSPYRLGLRSGWIKVKTPTWRAANREQWRLFEKRWPSAL
jgi:ATP-dependent DNA ligase